MASTQALNAASQDRKARLAQLKSLKRKEPPSNDDESQPNAAKSPRHDASEEPAEDDTSHYLSGRNYDPLTKSARLGFESAPSSTAETLEARAASLAAETKKKKEEEEAADKPLDLFTLQPKKANWDLKRDLERKLEVLNVRTENAIARMVRERIGRQQRKAREVGVNGEGDGEAAGIEGTTLVEGANLREAEEREEARREREEEEEIGAE
ncbi:uncharacterized protein LTR77_004212 [Saxophila tyrrhenica]|uniref:Cwf18 pre-mRNA splicing factor n=1 Tax=Saxophila tyrrhenica TaxID=1690608 RepID=A0AAV9PG35_9PEZI|nr:hypothetical protein LTR77_004212 [Saxophila tyrrhenica]